MNCVVLKEERLDSFICNVNVENDVLQHVCSLGMSVEALMIQADLKLSRDISSECACFDLHASAADKRQIYPSFSIETGQSGGILVKQ